MPDALSRSVPVVDVLSPESQIIFPDFKDKWYLKMLQNISTRPLNHSLWRVEDNIIYHHTRNPYPGLDDPAYDWKIVVPKSHRLEIIKQHHDTPTSGHVGVYKTFHRLAQKYYWPKMKSDVARYIRNCQICLAQKPEQRRPAGLMCGRPDITKPWELISVDIVGPLPKSSSGYMYILSVQDYFSKFCIFLPMRTANSKTIVKLLEDNVFLLFGAPHMLLSDNGKQFTSNEFKNVAKEYNIKLINTPYYHPQANACERQHRVLKTILSSFVKDNHRTWDKLLQKAACAIRTARSESTGLSPFFVNFGREIILDGTNHIPPPIAPQPGENTVIKSPEERATVFPQIFKNVRKRLDKALTQSQKTYNLRRRDVKYEVGQLVWRKNYVLSDAARYFTAKLAPKFVGPFIVHRKVSPWTYELRDPDGELCGVWNVKDLKPNTGDVTK